MGYLSEQEYESRMKKIQEKNASIERKRKLREEKKKYNLKIKMPSTSKLILFIVFVMCVEILIYSQYAMIVLGDISAMYTLIGVPVTLVPITIGYYWKSKNENTVNGIVYEKAMHELDKTEFEADDEISYEISEDAQG